MSRCVIVGGAPIENYERIKTYFRPDDYVVICDAGLKHWDRLAVTPGLIVGDFDSCPQPDTDIETIVLPTVKDDTDTVHALKEAMARGYRDFLLVGMTGRRLDHTLGNVYMLLSIQEAGCSAVMVDDYSEISLITPGQPAKIGDELPFFSTLAICGRASGICIRGAKYPLQDAVIEPKYQYGISNEVLPGETAFVSVEEGVLLLIRDFVG